MVLSRQRGSDFSKAALNYPMMATSNSTVSFSYIIVTTRWHKLTLLQSEQITHRLAQSTITFTRSSYSQSTQQESTAQLLLIVLALSTDSSPPMHSNSYKQQKQRPRAYFKTGAQAEAATNSYFLGRARGSAQSRAWRVFQVSRLQIRDSIYQRFYSQSYWKASWSKYQFAICRLSQKRSPLATCSGLKKKSSQTSSSRLLKTLLQLWQNPQEQGLDRTALSCSCSTTVLSASTTSTSCLLGLLPSFLFFRSTLVIKSSFQKNSPLFFFSKCTSSRYFSLQYTAFMGSQTYLRACSNSRLSRQGLRQNLK